MSDKTLAECQDVGNDRNPNTDIPSPYCSPDEVLSQPNGSQKDTEFDVLNSTSKKLGHEANCDPMQRSGWGEQFRENHSDETINRYSQVLRGADQAMKELFDDITVTDDNGKEHKVPIIIKSQEKAVAFIIQENVRKDNSFVVDRIRLPILSIYRSDIQPDYTRYHYHKAINYFRVNGKPGWTTDNQGRERGTIFGKAWGIPVNLSYQLSAWTMYSEDMNQIIEQVITKFSPIAYIKIQGVDFETAVKHESTANNQEVEPGDKEIRVLKYRFDFTVQTYVPQPIVKKKAVLDIKVDVLESIENDQIVDVLNKIELSVEENEQCMN